MPNITNIDAIVEMILEEARARDSHNVFNGVYSVIGEIFHKANWIIVNHMLEERRKREDENKG